MLISILDSEAQQDEAERQYESVQLHSGKALDAFQRLEAAKMYKAAAETKTEWEELQTQIAGSLSRAASRALIRGEAFADFIHSVEG